MKDSAKRISDMSAFLLDMDGTVYLGDRLIDGAADMIGLIREKGKRLLFLTNNSSKNRRAYVEKLASLGVEVLPDEVFTSGEATTLTLAGQVKRVFLLGTPSLREEFERAGYELTDENPEAVVLGFDTTLTYEKLHTACDFLHAGLPFIATHPDLNCPLPGGARMPDVGAMIAFFQAATGRLPRVIGKPNDAMVEAIEEKYGFDRRSTVMVGDRLYTDIAMGEAAGIYTALVLSGETGAEEYENQSRYRADFLFPSAAEIAAELRGA